MTTWSLDFCLDQAILRLREHPALVSTTPTIVQDVLLDMPYSREVIEQAQQQYHTRIIESTTICTFSECVEQVKLLLYYQLPADYDARECYLQQRLPSLRKFRKQVIKMALWDLLAVTR